MRSEWRYINTLPFLSFPFIVTDGVAWSVVCVCLLSVRGPCKTAQPIEMPFGADLT